MKVKTLILNQSTLSDYQACPFKSKYLSSWSYELDPSESRNQASQFGTIIHKFRELLLRKFPIAHAKAEAINLWNASPALVAHSIPDEIYSLEALNLIMDSYLKEYNVSKDHEHFTDRSFEINNKTVEIPLSAHLGQFNGIEVILKGTLDGIHSDSLLVDMKTGKSLYRFTFPSAESSYQFIFYTHMVKETLGKDLIGVVIDGVSTNLSDYKSTTKTEPLQRKEIIFQPSYKDKFIEDISDWSHFITQSIISNKFPRIKASCNNFFRPCEFYLHCNGSASMTELTPMLMPSTHNGAYLLLEDNTEVSLAQYLGF